MGSIASTQNKSSIPAYQPDENEHRQQIARWAIQVMQGKLNNYGSVTLTPGAGTTTVTDARVGINSFIGFMPTTANAASAGPSMYVASRTDSQFIITHSNTGSVDKTFVYCVLG